MKPNTIPVTCGTALALMCAVVATHWMSVRQLVELAELTRSPAAIASPTVPTTALATATTIPASPAALPAAPARQDSISAADQKEIDELKQIVKLLAHQNQDLHEQVGETNRDLMELQFRVDTHSESFRPLRTTQSPEAAYDQSPGVLPPREQP